MNKTLLFLFETLISKKLKVLGKLGRIHTNSFEFKILNSKIEFKLDSCIMEIRLNSAVEFEFSNYFGSKFDKIGHN